MTGTDIANEAVSEQLASVRRFAIQASVRNPSESSRPDVIARELRATRYETSRCALRFLQRGYWVEVLDRDSNELLAGPFNPDSPPPDRIV